MATAMPLLAQQATFKSSVSLLQVDVTVLDRAGAPVPGLTADDFVVTLNSKRQPVRSAAFIEAGGATPGSELNAHGVEISRQATNNASRTEPRLFVVMADDLSLSATNGKGLFVAAERFLSRVPAGDWIGVTTTSGLGRSINPTQDHRAVETVLRKTFGAQFDPRAMGGKGPFVGMNEALEIDSGMRNVLVTVIQRECPSLRGKILRPDQMIVDDSCAEEVDRRARRTATMAKRQTAEQIASYVAAINAMAAAPGIKHLVILTGGLALHNNAIDLNVVARAAAAAGVQLTVMGEEPDENPEVGGSRAQIADDRQRLQWAQTMADMSGGQFFTVIGQADRFFDRVLQSASAVYRLGVELPADIPAGAEIAVTAKVNRPNLTTLASHHSAAPSNAPALPIDDQLRAAIASGQTRYGVPIRMATAIRRSPTDAALNELIVNVAVPSAVAGPLTTVFGLVDGTGALKSGRRVVATPTDRDDYRLSFALPVTSSQHVLRFAVADATGAVGSIDVPVRTALAAGPIPSSDLLVWVADAAGHAQFLTIEELPSQVNELHAMLELYVGDMPPADLSVKMSLTRSGDANASVTANALLAREKDIVRAEAPVSVANLAPGTYLLRATVFAANNVMSELTTTITKVR